MNRAIAAAVIGAMVLFSAAAWAQVNLPPREAGNTAGGASAGSGTVMWAKVKWIRSYEAGLTTGRTGRKPVMIAFRPAPGADKAADDKDAAPLKHPLFAETAALVAPVYIFTTGGTEADSKTMAKFKVAPQDAPTVRFVDARGNPVEKGVEKTWSAQAVVGGMAAALETTFGKVPDYLKLARLEYAPARREKAVFAMSCFWEGQGAFGKLDGVIGTRAGFIDGKEAVEVEFDPTVTPYATLVKQAKEFKCASWAYARTPEQEAAAKPYFGDNTVLSDKPFGENVEQFHYLIGRRVYFYLPLTALQATRLNSLGGTPTAEAQLSPRQLALKKLLDQLFKADKEAAAALLKPLKPDRSSEGVGKYAEEFEAAIKATVGR